MSEALTAYPHLMMSPDGAVRVGTSRYKAIHLAAEHFHHGWSAEELLRQHSDLRPEQVYAALTWFYDHYEQTVAELRATYDFAAEMKPAKSLTRAELLSRSKLTVRSPPSMNAAD